MIFINKYQKILHVSKELAKTNARIKHYINHDVVQVCNYSIFSTGVFDTPPRLYDVSSPGNGIDKARSFHESKRRAKNAVLDIALCNKFDYMFTWTLDGEKIDRYNSDLIYKKLRSFLSNIFQRKGFVYVVIPEYHGLKSSELIPALHMHGLCNLGDVEIKPACKKNGVQRVTKSGQPIYNMIDWKYGFSTVVPLDNNYEKACMYVTKYITKSEHKIFGKWYLSSRSLSKKPDIDILDYINYKQFEADNKDIEPCPMYSDVLIINKELYNE